MSGYWEEWQSTTKRVPWTRGCTAMPPCCYCRRPASETQIRFYRIKPGTPIDQIPYMTPAPELRCEPTKGCNAAPWSKSGAYLRALMWDGRPPFIRKRDGARLEFAE